MLSIANISSSAVAAKYYEEDDYYTEGNIAHQNLSQWFGQGAKKLCGCVFIEWKDHFVFYLEF